MCMCVIIPAGRWEPYLVPTMSERRKKKGVNVPVCVARADTEAKGDGNVAPEALSKFSGDGGNRHC